MGYRTTLRMYAHAASPATQRVIVPDYAGLQQRLGVVQRRMDGRPLTLAEKILYSHLADAGQSPIPVRGESYLKLKPDRVAMQDASAQMALLQFMLSGLPNTAVPTSIHCDHLIEAYQSADKDVSAALVTNREIFDFLQSAAEKYQIQFWKPGSGIIHQIVLENYAAPGTLMLGTDSHTPNAGGLGMLAIGVGGADAVDAMADIPWELKAPKVLGVRLTGRLNGWTSPKDIILSLAGKLSVRGGTGHIIEYFGPGTESLSCTGMGTICNMGAEVGATTSVFPFSPSMARYLTATRRQTVADAATRAQSFLRPDEPVLASPEKYYDDVVEINLDKLEPHINGPFTPDLSFPLSQLKTAIQDNQWPDDIKVGLIGSCTNSSYEDMTRATSIARQAAERGVKTNAEFLVTPGSEQIRATIARDGLTQSLEQVGARVLANACGPCIGQWRRTDETEGQDNVIISSFNRNFKARNDGNAKTMNFLASPEIVTAMTLAGKLSFNPMTDSLLDQNGQPFKLAPPRGEELPGHGFDQGRLAYQPVVPEEGGSSIGTGTGSSMPPTSSQQGEIKVDPSSTRLQILEPFPSWSGHEFNNVRVLVRVQGKCTTDHISAAGKWLKYKGHLENIAHNTLIGAVNADTQQVNEATHAITKQTGTIPEIGFAYRKANIPWMVIADHNYGEGSAREHAAMQPRYLGCVLVLTKSFARIHETNLKKQGVLPLTFANEGDYDRLTGDGSITVATRGVKSLAPGSPVHLVITQTLPDGTTKTFDIATKHTMSEDQIEWFKAGSALNRIAALAGNA
ncbi:aconitate hydratase [Dimargaris verticillata]|uniref:Aconitate hydratase, mitochondrial n=1 Tax=Dimargaris verticillata TaxID=2761393 RepID=A0A9W8B8U5_9FUNG|nr:aconitate hydratase [Dimargaris verticillata]